jgi:hypothetical protein
MAPVILPSPYRVRIFLPAHMPMKDVKERRGRKRGGEKRGGGEGKEVEKREEGQDTVRRR